MVVKACEPAGYSQVPLTALLVYDYWTDCLVPECTIAPASPGPLVLVVDPVELDLVQDVEVAEVGGPLALPGPDQLVREGASLH